MAVLSSGSGGTGSASDNEISITPPSGMLAGRLLVFTLFKKNNQSVSAPSGFTQIESTYNSTGSVEARTYYKIIEASDIGAEFSFSWSSAVRCSLSYDIFRNIDPNNPVSSAVEGTSDNTANPTFSGTSLTPTIADSAIYIVQASNENSNILDATSGDITMASNTISPLMTGGADDNSTLNHAQYSFRLGTFGATGNFSFSGGSAGSDWAMHAFVVNAADPTVVTAFTVKNTSDANIASQSAGVPFNIKLSAVNGLGDLVTSYTGTVDITSTGEISSGSGTTPSFVAGVLTPHSITIDNFGSFTITATKTGDTENGVSNSFAVTGVLNIQKHEGDVYSGVQILPTLSNVSHINIIMAPIPGLSGTKKEAAIKFYFNMSPTASFTKYVTRDDIAKGYVSYEINKQYVNSIQLEVEHFNASSPSPDADYSNIGVADFCPAYAEIIYERTDTIR